MRRQTDDYDANMFFWYFPAQTPAANGPTPLIIWLQGGPGSSSMIGLFYEMGPLRVGPDMLLHRNGDTWNTNCSMVFIDNPVGTGYSNVLAKEDAHIAGMGQVAIRQPCLPLKDEATGDRATPHFVKGYVNNQAAVGHDLVVFLKKFYAIFPEELSSPLYLSGESYAGKYVPHFATSVLNHNARLNADAEDSHLIPLRGVAIGNGLTDPSSQVLLHAPQALALGLVSKKQSEKMMEAAKSAVSLAGEGRWRDAASERERIFDLFKNFTGGINWYDVRKGDVPNDWSDMIKLLNLPATKEAVNVPQGAAFETDAGVRTHLAEDIMRSAKPEVERLLREGIKVMLYQGQFDFRDGILASTDWINSMEWKGKDSFLEADRRIWKVQGHVAGYLTSYGLLRRHDI
ncbi:hypothetical protein HK101_001868 [Irineochytrium annulatum]|nr:hypothetical protein HK101_001868 [Irineochytrium annulatum]